MTPPALRRNLRYEVEFLREAAKAAERRHGLPAGAFVDHVTGRLAAGEKLYGNAWRDRDLPVEAAEEGLDAAAYAVLEAQKRMATDYDDDVLWHTHEIAVLSAAIYAHAQALRHTA